MSYVVKIKGDKKIVTGGYIPKQYSCKCKECKFTIELPSTATDSDIENLVNMIRR